jgi:AcrR family transcriptional regulator
MSTRQERRERLIEVAREVILRHGYRKANLGDVAREAGVSRATVYNYFANKELLLRAIVAQETQRLREAVAGDVDPRSPPHLQLLDYVRSRARHISAIKELYDLAHNVTRDVLPIVAVEIEEQQAQERAYVVALIQVGVRQGLFHPVDPELLGSALLSALRGLYEDYVFDSTESSGEGAELLVRTLLRGMLREPDLPLLTSTVSPEHP